MSGKKGVAPCGCVGTHITANYVSCDRGCDSGAIPVHVEVERTKPLCRHCGSDKLAIYPGFTDPQGQDLWHCNSCGLATLA